MAYAFQKHLAGKNIGMAKNDVLIANMGMVQGRQFVVTEFDDFTGSALTSWAVAKGSDAGAANFAPLASTPNGIVRGSTGAGATLTMAVNGVQLSRALTWQANTDDLTFEVRFKVSAISTLALFVGLTDQLSALEMPINSASSADTFTTTATDAVGFMYDTAMTTQKWWLTGVANDTDATMLATSLAPVAATYTTLKIALDKAGNATGYIDGVNIGSIASAVTPTIPLTPVVAAFRRSAASANIDVDYIQTYATRT